MGIALFLPFMQVRGLVSCGKLEPVSGIEPLTCRLQGGCSAI
jgi:hypothetical protein